MAPHSSFLSTLLIFFLSFHKITSVDYQVTNDVPNTIGGTCFTNEIGVCYTKELMGTITNFLWLGIFQQYDPSNRKPIDLVNLYIEEIDFPIIVTWGNNNMNISSIHLAQFNGDVKREFTSIMYHEMTHVFQWTGGGKAPRGLLEGIADYTKLQANLQQPDFAKPGEGDFWFQGYDVTARFLKYYDGITPGFVAQLNKMMKVTFEFNYFKILTGKPIYQLWLDYKIKYGYPCCKN